MRAVNVILYLEGILCVCVCLKTRFKENNTTGIGKIETLDVVVDDDNLIG